MTFDEELKRAFDTLSERLQEEVVRQVAAARVAPGDESLPPTDLAASERLLTAIRAIDRASSLREVLDTLVSAAGREASRVALVLVRADKFHGWRFIGFGPALDTAAHIEIPGRRLARCSRRSPAEPACLATAERRARRLVLPIWLLAWSTWPCR